MTTNGTAVRLSEATTEPELSVVNDIASRIESKTGLDINSAKAAVLYSLCTRRLEDLRICPIVVIKGPYSTGKTTAMYIFDALSPSVSVLNGRSTTKALRRQLFVDKVTIIDEADGIDESLLQSRYDRATSVIALNSKTRSGDWEPVERSVFGATLLLVRLPFSDGATLSRSIVLESVSKSPGNVTPYQEGDFDGDRERLSEIGSSINFDGYLASTGDRIGDTWNPLLWVAQDLGDEEWIGWAEIEMEAARYSLAAGQQVEPALRVYSALLNLSLRGEESFDSDVAERVDLAILREFLAADGFELSSQQIGQIAESMGFERRTKGGHSRIYTGGNETLVEIGRRIGSDDEWITNR